MVKRAASKGNTKPAGKGKRGGRKSKAESVTGAKENETEVSAVLDLKPIEIDEKTFDTHYKSIKSALDKKETAMSLLRTCRKHAKEAGEDLLKAVDVTLRLERQDPETIRNELQIMGYSLQKANCPIQISMHNTLLGDVNQIAYDRGFADGEAGRTASSGYPMNSEPDRSYMKGWRHGNGKNMGLTPEQVDAALAAEVEEAGGQPEPMWNEDAPHLTEEKPAEATVQ